MYMKTRPNYKKDVKTGLYQGFDVVYCGFWPKCWKSSAQCTYRHPDGPEEEKQCRE